MIWIIESFCVLSAIQGLGLLGLIASRLGERCYFCQSMFFFAMLIVATATLCSVLVGSGTWAISGTTLALMVVGATLDCGRLQQVRSCQ